jgi:predicted RNA-binding Zn-ribbon protein involved in translation (DUF1610 family)
MAKKIATTCPECGREMEPGFVVDFRHGSREAAEWIEGPPERSFWLGTKIRGKRRLAVESFRCPDCGLLKSYARRPSTRH